jgi:two-component system CheB/CheR fusion protein
MSARTRQSDGLARGRKRPKGENAERSPGAQPADAVATDLVEQSEAAFPIVGVGASAGGLEAFTQLLEALPLDTGMGFVLVQHLDPDHESQLTQILSRVTSLPGHIITNDEPVKPNHVYVIPRDTSLTLSGGVLKMQPRERPRTLQRTIDTFFESLAQDRRERAVGVVLSGTASDGTLGLEAIKAEGGITFAQDDSAKHSSMPRTAVAAGCVDLVLSPAEIAKELARIAKHPYVAGQALHVFEQGGTPAEDDRTSATAHEDDQTPLPSGGNGAPDTGADEARIEGDDESKPARGDSNDYKKILLLLRNHSGVDFSLYKSATIQRRITRRLVLGKHDTPAAYANFLRGNVPELDALYSDVLISVTSFFRNPETFDVLQEKVLPQLLTLGGADPLRCWVLGCSTGQEAYSIAMAFSEAIENAPRMRTLQIFASDLNDALLEKARHGLYAKSLAEDITPERLRRFFVEEEGGYRIHKSLREMVVFARQNLIADPPFSRMDLVSCRNLLIYLEPSLQKKALPTFHYALKPGGFLLLGASESISGFTDLFEPVDKKHKIYSKKSAHLTSLHLPLKKEHGREPTGPRLPLPTQKGCALDHPEGLRSEVDATREADRVSVTQFAPPGVLVNAELQVLQFRGATGAFLEPPVGKASFDLLKMAGEGLMLPLRSTINQAKKDNKPVRKEKVRVKRNGKTRMVNVEVIPLKNLRERCFLILFEEANKKSADEETRPKPVRKGRPSHGTAEPSRIAELEAELSEMREYLNWMRDQHEAVQSANEEVQSSNEELQSINEELETSKEELESANEELTTVNDEMSNRDIELNRLNNDLINLQASAKLAVILFGRDLTIRRFSPQAEKQFDLVVADVGRPISHLRHSLVEVEQAFPPSPDQQTGLFVQRETPLDLDGLVAGVIAEVREQERQVRDKAGRWHSLRVRPYMTADAKVDGAVLLLVDVHQPEWSEQASSRLAAIIESSDDAIVSTTLGGVITSWNGGAEMLFGYSADEAIERHISLIIPTELRSDGEAVLARLARGEKLAAFETERQTKDGRRIPISLKASPIKDATGQIVGVSKASRDITDRKRAVEEAAAAKREFEADRKRADEAIRESEARFRTLADNAPVLIWVNGPDGAEYVNRTYWEFLGASETDVLSFDWTSFVHPEDRDAYVNLYLRISQKREMFDAEFRFRRHDGEYRWMRSVASPRFSSSGTYLGYVGSTFDITKEKVAEHDREQLVAQLRSAIGSRDEFLSIASHELRTPLTTLALQLDGLRSMFELEADHGSREEVRRRLDMVARQSDRLTKLVDGLLDVSRINVGALRLDLEEVDLVPLIREVTEWLSDEAKRAGCSISFTGPATAVGNLDRLRVEQSVTNLISNALKYGSGTPIDLTLKLEADGIKLAVRNRGMGIAGQDLERIFGRFERAVPSKHYGGLGLGLYITRQIVEAHGGSIAVVSQPGEGATFTVSLPPFAAPLPARTKGDDAKVVNMSETRMKGHILVVEDDPDIRETVVGVLKDAGYSAAEAEDGLHALEYLNGSHESPDLILLDLKMPNMNGFQFRKAQLKDPRHSVIPVALVSADAHLADKAAELRADGFAPKPLNIAALLALVERVLTRPQINHPI